MKWRLTKVLGGWVIEYKPSIFSGWTPVINNNSFSFEPDTAAKFDTKEEAATEMAKLIAKYS